MKGDCWIQDLEALAGRAHECQCTGMTLSIELGALTRMISYLSIT
jgi:hypothetical protein